MQNAIWPSAGSLVVQLMTADDVVTFVTVTFEMKGGVVSLITKEGVEIGVGTIGEIIKGVRVKVGTGVGVGIETGLAVGVGIGVKIEVGCDVKGMGVIAGVELTRTGKGVGVAKIAVGTGAGTKLA